jgi:hypothetical protein
MSGPETNYHILNIVLFSNVVFIIGILSKYIYHYYICHKGITDYMIQKKSVVIVHWNALAIHGKPRHRF